MAVTISVTETAVFTALVSVLGSFGLAASDGGTFPIIRGQINQVPEPAEPDYLVMTPILADPLSTTIETDDDIQVTGSIANNVMTVATVTNGPVEIGMPLYGGGVTVGCSITGQLTGSPGGPGTYSVTPTVPVTGVTMYCGTLSALQPEELTIQVEIHGPASSDNRKRLSALWRSTRGVQAFFDAGILDGSMAPLYIGGMRQVAFIDSQKQYENRWIIDLCMQTNPIIRITEEFADQLKASLIEIDASFPP